MEGRQNSACNHWKPLVKSRFLASPVEKNRPVTWESWFPAWIIDICGKPLVKQHFACLAGIPHCTFIRGQRHFTACLECNWTAFKAPASVRSVVFGTISCPLTGQLRALSKRTQPPFYLYIWSVSFVPVQKQFSVQRKYIGTKNVNEIGWAGLGLRKGGICSFWPLKRLQIRQVL